MDYITRGLIEAVKLLLSGDREIYQIIGLSLSVSMLATLFAALIGIPLGLLTGLRQFPLKRLYRTILYSLMGIPPVVIGLIVMLFLSRKGPLGHYEMLFTPQAMWLAQVLLVLPIIVGVVFGSADKTAKAVSEVGITLGCTLYQRLILLISELRNAIWLALASAFGRAISEVGAVMLVGGNIKEHTRVMTTFIALNNSMGSYEKSIAMGLMLLLIALIVNGAIHYFSGGGSHEY